MIRYRVSVRAYLETPPVELVLPVTIAEYAELWRTIEAERLAGRLAVWKALMRLWSSGDGYFLLRYALSAGRDAWSVERNEPHFQTGEHLELARRIQFGEPVALSGTLVEATRTVNADDAVLVGARGFGKTTHFIADDIRHKLPPEMEGSDASTWFSLTRELNQKTGNAIQRELETNALLLGVWPDRFWQSAEERPTSVKWSLRDGLSIKRATTRPEQSFEFNAFETGLPTGTHPDGRYYNDALEAERAAESPDVQRTIEDRWISSQRLHSSRPRRRVGGTYYLTNGIMARLDTEYGLRTWLYPGEDLRRPEPNKELAGPLGGAPANGFSREDLWRELAASGGAIRDEETGAWRMTGNIPARRNYSGQIACYPLAGEAARLEWSMIRQYGFEELMRERRRGNAIICLDSSKGINDPSALWVWLLTLGHDYYWVDGELKILPPALRAEMVFQICAKWKAIARDAFLRIENFGQSEAYERQIEYHASVGFEIETMACHDTRKSKQERAFERWQPPCANGRVFFPKEMLRQDELGNSVDLVARFKAKEFDPFPQGGMHMLDAGGLVWESEDRVGALPWPVQHRESRPVPSATGYASAGVL